MINFMLGSVEHEKFITLRPVSRDLIQESKQPAQLHRLAKGTFDRYTVFNLTLNHPWFSMDDLGVHVSVLLFVHP